MTSFSLSTSSDKLKKFVLQFFANCPIGFSAVPARRMPLSSLRKLKRWPLLIFVSLLALYCLGYGYYRHKKWIVHYTASVDGKCTSHDINAADVKMGGGANLVAAFYTPLRYVELAFWKVTKPMGSRCT